MMHLLHCVFNLGVLNSDATEYFESLVNQALDERMKSSAGRSQRPDLLQTLADNLTDIPEEDKLTDDDGNQWTETGKLCCDMFLKQEPM